MMMRLSSLLIALVLGGATLARAGTTLTVAAYPDIDRAVKEAAPQFKKLHPDVEIKVISRAIVDHHNAMTTALSTGSNLPDVLAIEFGFIGRFAASGGMESLSQPPYNAGQFQDKFVRFSYPQATSGSSGLIAMPTDIGPGSLFYRKDILDKAGVTEADLTRTWESYIEAGKKIKAATGAYLLPHVREIKDIYIRSNLRSGEGIYLDRNNTVLVDGPRFVKAFELAKAARAAKLDAKLQHWTNEWTEAFKRGTLATELMGAWLGGHLQNWIAPDSKGLWRAANLPNGAYASWGGSFYGIPKKAEHKELAWEFIKFMTLNKDIQLASFRKINAFPALVEAHDDPAFEEPIEYLGGQKARTMWRAAAAHIPATDVNKYDPVAEEIVNSELDKVLDEGKDIKAALADAKALIQRRVRR
ncbi:ABC transporter substrate-binding protein [Archangium sp.]|uniref:ABC transporter substrate-binding protein n=1 Tax=Archangium sp. TaxID=1872627 RepID=UPI002D6A2DF9|nr:extracellular solute-binding protein [Archangium sp.]HYO51411.1 extracellular solute-binding protein [Archangium sp.]